MCTNLLHRSPISSEMFDRLRGRGESCSSMISTGVSHIMPVLMSLVPFVSSVLSE
jgi:hypothetical protein